MLYPQAVPSTELQIKENILLAPYSTFRIGGPARFFAEVTTEDELLEAIQFARQRNLEIFTLGGGSNLLISDSGFDGLVIHVALDAPVGFLRSGNFIDCAAAAGMDWNSFVLAICEQGISGVECLAGIPGSVGGTPVQNVGAYGQEVASTITHVRALDLESNTFVSLVHEECGFAYRHSIFNTTHRNRYIVTQVMFSFNGSARPNLTYADLKKHFASQLANGEIPSPLDIYHAVRSIRHGKGMLIVDGEADCRSAGSFFKNPVVPESVLAHVSATLQIPVEEIPHWPAPADRVKLAAAWLLEKAGFPKGFAIGNAGISSRHTLALINRGNATAAEIATLRDTIRKTVAERFGVQLEQEPVQLGL